MVVAREGDTKMQSACQVLKNPAESIAVSRGRIGTKFSGDADCVGEVGASADTNELKATNYSLIGNMKRRKSIVRGEKD